MRANFGILCIAAAAAFATGPDGSAGAAQFTDLYEMAQASGYAPIAGVIGNDKGALFGTTVIGGNGSCDAYAGCGTVYELAPHRQGKSWVFSVLYNFQNQDDGYYAQAPVIIGPYGVLYGYSSAGSYGRVYRLTPPPKGHSEWTFQVIYQFTGGADGNLNYAYSPLVWRKGALYGIASGGSGNCGSLGCGSLFRLTPPQSGSGIWTEKTLYSFTGGSDGGMPAWIARVKGQSALYVATSLDHGAVAQFVPAGHGKWSETVLTEFSGGTDGSAPSNLLLTGDGTIYGTANTPNHSGLVFQVAQSGGSWTRTTLANISVNGYGPTSLAFGPNGSLIGVVSGDPDYFSGAAFQLAQSNGKWKLTKLYDFDNAPDQLPINMVVGLGGNFFGVTNGGHSSSGSLFELQPSAR